MVVVSWTVTVFVTVAVFVLGEPVAAVAAPGIAEYAPKQSNVRTNAKEMRRKGLPPVGFNFKASILVRNLLQSLTRL
jgi:hypothetical protein